MRVDQFCWIKKPQASKKSALAYLTMKWRSKKLYFGEKWEPTSFDHNSTTQQALLHTWSFNTSHHIKSTPSITTLTLPVQIASSIRGREDGKCQTEIKRARRWNACVDWGCKNWSRVDRAAACLAVQILSCWGCEQQDEKGGGGIACNSVTLCLNVVSRNGDQILFIIKQVLKGGQQLSIGLGLAREAFFYSELTSQLEGVTNNDSAPLFPQINYSWSDMSSGNIFCQTWTPLSIEHAELSSFGCITMN